MKIFLATCEHPEHYAAASFAGIKNVLFSFYHLQNKGEKALNNFPLMNQRGQEAICDSGLFTMMFGAGKDKTYTYDDLLKYTKNYISQAQKFGIQNLTIVEMDTHKILPLEKLFEFRKHFENSGMNVLYVWHVEEGIEGLYRMAEKYEYIALSVPELRILCKGKSTRYQDVIHDLLYKIKKNTTRMPKVHLLGNTVAETMETNLAYSCDSSSWTYGVRHARPIFYVDGKPVCKYLGRNSDEKWIKLFEQEGMKIMDENPEVKAFLDGKTKAKQEYYLHLIFCANSYQKYQEKLNTLKTCEADL